MLSIEKQIADTDLQEMIKLFPNAPYEPYSYQVAVYRVSAAEIRSYSHPFIIKAAVSAGKTTIISLLTTTVQRLNMPAMVLSRQGEIVEQDAAEMWNFGVKNSIFCASLNMKSTSNKIIVGSEKTVANALMNELEHFAPLVLLIDECVTGDTLIETDQGQVRVDDPTLADRKILCIDDSTGERFYHKPVRVFTNGVKSVSSLRLSSGEEIKCTSNHKLLSQGLWVQSGSLKPGDTLTLLSQHDSFCKKLLRACAAVGRKLTRK